MTHSDTLLRQAVGNGNYHVYHMLSPTSSTGNQASEVLLNDDIERVVVDLVGDLAAYRPHAKVVILEVANQDAFDEMFVRRLFPDFAKRVNLVSAGSKRRVRDLYAVLDDAITKAGVANRFFAIVDNTPAPRQQLKSSPGMPTTSRTTCLIRLRFRRRVPRSPVRNCSHRPPRCKTPSRRRQQS